MYLIEFIGRDTNTRVWANPAFISHFGKHENGVAIVSIAGQSLTVKGTVEEITRLLQEHAILIAVTPVDGNCGSMMVNVNAIVFVARSASNSNHVIQLGREAYEVLEDVPALISTACVANQ